jgi:hypothetical protein
VSESLKLPWHVENGGNYVEIGAEGFHEYVEKHHNSATPLKICTMNYRPDDGVPASVAEVRARFIVSACNSHEANLARIAQLESEIAAAKAQREWRRIETYHEPDGTPVLLRAIECELVASAQMNHEGLWISEQDGDEIDFEPAYWMPLPAGPEEEMSGK